MGLIPVRGTSTGNAMTKEDSAKVLAVKYVYDYNTFARSDRLRHDLADIHFRYMDDADFNAMFDRYSRELERLGVGNAPRWAKLIMAERYALNI